MGREEEKTLVALIKPHGFFDGFKTAFIFWDGVWPLSYQKKISYGRLWKNSSKFGAFLNEQGVGAGDRVGLMLPNSPQFAVAYFGILKIGAVAVPMSLAYEKGREKEQILKILQNSGVKLIIAWEKYHGIISQLKDSADIKKIIVTGPEDALPFWKAKIYNFKLRRKGEWVKFPKDDGFTVKFSMHKKAGIATKMELFNKPDDLAVILYTSGTTGDSKGAMFTHEALISNAKSCRKLVEGLGMREGEEVFLAAAPYFHIMGIAAMLHTPLLMRAKIILVLNPKDIKSILNAVKFCKATGFVGPPAFYKAMAGLFVKEKNDFSSLKVCISGASKLEDSIRKKFESFWGGKILEGFGMTEAGVTHCQRAPGEGIGYVLDGIEEKLYDADENQMGELCVRGKNLMSGYRNNPEKTREMIDGEGWLHTGDMAKAGKDGSLLLLGRIDDDFIKMKDGEKIPLGVSERILLSHPQVVSSAVIAKPDGNGKFLLKGFVVLRDPEMACNDLIKSQFFKMLEELPANQRPDEIQCIEELPTSPMGKVLKKILRRL